MDGMPLLLTYANVYEEKTLNIIKFYITNGHIYSLSHQ